jgi:hypothetical protein
MKSGRLRIVPGSLPKRVAAVNRLTVERRFGIALALCDRPRYASFPAQGFAPRHCTHQVALVGPETA